MTHGILTRGLFTGGLFTGGLFTGGLFTGGLVTLGLILLGNLSTPAMAQGPKLITEVEGITEYRLDNGVKLLLFPDDSKPQFTVNMTVMVGSRHEGYGESGMAHLLEHMLFRGTDLYPDIPKFLKDRGVLNMNGTTSFDRTNYFETLPATDDNLDFAISMEADRLVNSWIKQEHLSSEMTIVRSEFERGENSPQRILFQRIMDAGYQWHNYGKSTIGNRSDIMRVPATNLRVFYKKFYRPDNITLVVAGKFDKEKALALVEEKFGSLTPPTEKIRSTYTEEPPQDGERNVVLRRSGDVQLVGLGYHVPSASSESFAPVEVLATLLSMQPSGPLYKNMVETKLATSASAFEMVGHDPGMLIAMAEVPPDVDLDDAKKVMIDSIESIGRDGVSDTVVNRAIRRIMKQREISFADSEEFATELTEWESYGDWRLYFLHRDRLEKVTAADIQDLAKTYLIQSNRTTGVFIPTKDAVRAKIGEQPDLKKLVADYKGREKISEGEAFEATPENIQARTQTGTLPSGIKYAILPKENRGDKVRVQGELHYGDAQTLSGKTMATKLLPKLMTRGTQQLSFQEFRDRLDELKATLNISGNVGTIEFNLQTERQHLEEVLDLLKQALREPALDEKEFEVVRLKQKTEVESGLSDPQMLAMVDFYRRLDPQPIDDVRYTPTMPQRLERVNNVSLADVTSLHEGFIGGEHGEIVVIGDCDADATLEKLASMFSDWSAKNSYARIEEPANPNAETGRFTINTPDKANALFIAGLVAPITDDDSQYEALLIGNYIMGGGPLSSRIADRVRKKDGLSYTARSSFRAQAIDPQAIYMMYCISNPANTEKVVETVAEVVNQMLTDGVTEDELAKAKESYLNNRRGGRAQDDRLAPALLENLQADRSMDYYAHSDKKIEALTKSDVDAAFKGLVVPEKFTIVTAGDFSKTDSPEDEEKPTTGE